jgi:hypothetical protein
MTPRLELPSDRVAKLGSLTDCQRIGLAQAPLSPADLAIAARPVLDASYPAPAPLAAFAQARAILRASLGKLPGDRVILVGDTALEGEWCAAARLAAYLPAERYFATP